MTDVVIPKTASRNYELELGIYDRIVMVDGLYNPLISLQFGEVRIMQSWSDFAIDILLSPEFLSWTKKNQFWQRHEYII